MALGGETIAINGYADVNWANDYDRKSTSGYIVWLNGPIIWKSAKQACIAISTNEAEYVSLSDSSKDVLFIKNILSELKIGLEEKSQMFCDNLATIEQLNQTDKPIPIKLDINHIDIKYHHIRSQKDHINFNMCWYTFLYFYHYLSTLFIS